ncbi:DUF4352 domain-containing protein [Thermococcus stetteri]|uniref:DUF4352 domain-containing protein n=1 Tax=Thermococcus stetteri TaxID=49900 RepID=UPI001AEAAE19|nr:DUF4352 domain-containing protein [Thermococcus stetteri]MBP1913006.1 hypothetical protein [Thermococcus stetteri]
MSKRPLSLALVWMIFLGIVLSAGCIGGGGSTTTITKTKPTTITHTTFTESPAPSSYAEGEVGKPVRASFKDYRGTKTVEVTVIDYIRGKQANQMIADANEFNDKPKPGNEYLLVKVRVKYIKGSGELSVGPSYFKAFANGAGRDYSWVVMPDSTPELELVDLIQGGEAEGWIAFEVPQSTEVCLRYYYNIFEDPIISIKIP